jgi:CelD/BcsL family acetyltransferase involved in cellulose biosynthesis
MLAPRELALTTEWRPLDELFGSADEWRALARRAAEPNVFYEPDFALAAAPALAPDAGAVLVYGLEPRRLIGLFPCRIERARYGVRLPLLVGWTHPYGPLGTPLVDPDALVPAVKAFVDHVANDSVLPKLLMMPYLVEDGPVAIALADAIARRSGRIASFGRHERALLAPGGDRAGYLEAALGRKKRKELGRQRRRLDDTGRVTFSLAHEPSDVAAAMEDFFTLEARGWKGTGGTAATQMAAIRTFMASATAALATHGQARVARLLHADRPIAAGVLLTSGRGSWFWKVAYDEAAARASPGVQLTLDLTDAVLGDTGVAWCDSCATADHAMIDSVWRERRPMVDQLIAVAPRYFTLACRLETLRRGAIAMARTIRALITGR